MASDDSPTVLTRREFGTLAAGALAAAKLAAQAPADVGPALDIADWSYFWYGVERVTLARGTVCNGMQMYVERWIPTRVRHTYPVVLIHGGYRQGSDWISTPDGRRGWATILLEKGYKVYVVDRPGQGRCPYHPYVHGNFDRDAPTFEKADWPGATDQYVAAMGQPMGNNPITQNVWRTRGAILLDDIGPAILITHGDGAVFALLTAEERPKLVKGIVAVEPPGAAWQGRLVPNVPMASVLAGASANDALPATVQRIPLANHGAMPMLEKNNREALQPVLDWLDSTVNQDVTGVTVDPHPNKESTALKLTDQGCFWVGVQRKTMSYGTIALGQMFVQYMIPAEKRSPYPVVMVHGGGGQGTHMMGIGGRPGWVHYFVQAGYSVYWVDRPSYGRSPYHPDALGPSHLPNVPPYEGLITSTAVFNTAQWPGPGGMNDPLIGQFMACESATFPMRPSTATWSGAAARSCWTASGRPSWWCMLSVGSSRGAWLIGVPIW
jgi:pimeloyl-ACP methyl ester carboxylesterase